MSRNFSKKGIMNYFSRISEVFYRNCNCSNEPLYVVTFYYHIDDDDHTIQFASSYDLKTTKKLSQILLGMFSELPYFEGYNFSLCVKEYVPELGIYNSLYAFTSHCMQSLNILHGKELIFRKSAVINEYGDIE